MLWFESRVVGAHMGWVSGFQEAESMKVHREGGRGTASMWYPVLGGRRVKRVRS